MSPADVLTEEDILYLMYLYLKDLIFYLFFGHHLFPHYFFILDSGRQDDNHPKKSKDFPKTAHLVLCLQSNH